MQPLCRSLLLEILGPWNHGDRSNIYTKYAYELLPPPNLNIVSCHCGCHDMFLKGIFIQLLSNTIIN